MKKISKDEFMAAPFARPVLCDEIRETLKGLQVGEGMALERAEWPLKSQPADYFANFGQQTSRRYKTRTLADNSGWYVLRTE